MGLDPSFTHDTRQPCAKTNCVTDRANLAKLACLYTSQIPNTRLCRRQCSTIEKLVKLRRNSNVVKHKFGVRRNSKSLVKSKFGVRSNRNILQLKKKVLINH